MANYDGLVELGCNVSTQFSPARTQSDLAARWAANLEVLNSDSCTNAFSVPPNSPAENDQLKSAILKASQETGLDSRFILAIAMQESNGCVHVHSTVSPDGTVRNPGLMQDHDGDHTCNLKKDTNPTRVGQIKGDFSKFIWNADNMLTPCPQEMIEGMIMDGVKGTTAGDGLMQTLTKGLGPVNGPHKRQATAPTQNVPIPAELSACDAAAAAQFSNAVWQAAVQYMQFAYSGSPLAPDNLSAPPAAASSKPATSVASVPPVSTTLSTVSVANMSAPASQVSSAPSSDGTENASTVVSAPATTVLPVTSVVGSPLPATSNVVSDTTAPASSASTDRTFASAKAVNYYRAARIYNSGSLPDPNALEAAASSTKCYVSDVANRLMGWNGLPASLCVTQG